MSTVLSQPFAVSDFRQLEDDAHGFEVIEGALCMAPASSRIHQLGSRNLCRLRYPFISPASELFVNSHPSL